MEEGLDSLPDDVLFLIFSYLDTARDVAKLALTCRRLHQLVQGEGWRIFAKTRFPSFNLQPAGAIGWAKISESLTWQSRCWDRRSLAFKAMFPPGRPGRAQGTRGFQPVLDAHFDPVSGKELLVWGAGENIVARYRGRATRRRAPEEIWRHLSGETGGYVPGYDDVRAVVLVENPQGRQGELGILAGRENGNLSLLSAEQGRFGTMLSTFSPMVSSDASSMPKGTQQDKIYSLDQSTHNGIIAAATRSHVLLYSLPQEQTQTVKPLATYDLSKDVLGHGTLAPWRAKWMANNDLLAIGLGGKTDPLRYLKVTPSGFELTVATKNAKLEERFAISDQGLCPNSIQPIGRSASLGGQGSLLLSAWKDGTCRLQDLRSPSPWDLVYHDNVDPWARFEALLPFGTERFVAGGLDGPTIKIFDFRWPKSYYHTSALPCNHLPPFPLPLQQFSAFPRVFTPHKKHCQFVLGHQCKWHDYSKDIYYRPNCSFFLAKSLPHGGRNPGIWSLAKSTDVSPNFYIGITGGLVEANLQSSDSISGDPNFGLEGGNGYYRVSPLDTSILETGDGLANPQNHSTIRLPSMRHNKGTDLGSADLAVPAALRKRHRLDNGFHTEADFKGVQLADAVDYMYKARFK